MKDRRTDHLKPEVATVLCFNGYTVTVRFQDGKILRRDKSHLKVINAAFNNREKLNGDQKFGTESQMNQAEIENSESDTDDSYADEEETQKIGKNTRSRREVKRSDRFGERTYY